MEVKHTILEWSRGRQPAVFFGAGVSAGLLLFLIWWSLQPSAGTTAPVGPASAPVASARALKPGEQGVLGAIAGEPALPQASSENIAPDGEPAQAGDTEGMDNSFGNELRNDAFDEESPRGSEQDDYANVQPGNPAMDGPPLQTFHVEIVLGPGVYEILRIQAQSPDDVRRILRDFRGNPRVTRGPSSQPLD